MFCLLDSFIYFLSLDLRGLLKIVVFIKTIVKVSHGGKCLEYKYYRGIKSVANWINLRLKVSIGADDFLRETAHRFRYPDSFVFGSTNYLNMGSLRLIQQKKYLEQTVYLASNQKNKSLFSSIRPTNKITRLGLV